MNLSRLLSHPLFVPFTLQAVLAYEWLHGGWDKISGGQFVLNIGKTLARFENGNPHEWYVGSVLRLAKDSPEVFGQLVQWGELMAGIGLVATLFAYGFSRESKWKNVARYVAAFSLFGGAFMNANFYYAAGWTSPSTGGLNMLMFWVQVVLILSWMKPREEKRAYSR
jgi:uncharacterized membrane protein YphA (DoxX/SURF4 family)